MPLIGDHHVRLIPCTCKSLVTLIQHFQPYLETKDSAQTKHVHFRYTKRPSNVDNVRASWNPCGTTGGSQLPSKPRLDNTRIVALCIQCLRHNCPYFIEVIREIRIL